MSENLKKDNEHLKSRGKKELFLQ